MTDAPLPTLHCACRPGGAPATPAPDEWAAVAPTPLVRWDGAADPLAASHGPSTFRLLWDRCALHAHVEVAFVRLAVDPALPRHKAHGLWEHDVAELFLSRQPGGLPYLELEGSPLGQQLDYLIHEPRRDVDREVRAGAAVAARLEEGRFTVSFALPWAALGGPAPSPGEVLRGNVLAAQGAPPERRYLAWSPTGTAAPDFHVPARFGRLVLAGPPAR